MEPLQTRLDALEQQMCTVTHQLRWWRGLAASLLALVVLTWALPSGTAPEEATAGGRESLAPLLPAFGELWHLLRYLTIATDEEGRPEVVITGANLRLVNGLGSTDCTDEQGAPIPGCPNGLGNLIVGYNERRLEGENIRTGSHNVVVGQQHNFSRVGGIVVGDLNTISGDFAAVSGGHENTASSMWSSVSGGELNTASEFAAAVSGGQGNTASGYAAAVSGGGLNTASGAYAAVSGGALNTASQSNAAVSGGAENTASGGLAAVSGGQGNTASGPFSAVSGGRNRTAAGEFDWVAGSLFEDE